MALFLCVRGLNSNAVLKRMYTKHWGDARAIPMLPRQANSTVKILYNTVKIMRQVQKTTHCKALASIFYLKAGTTAPKFLILGIYGNTVGEQCWKKKKTGWVKSKSVIILRKWKMEEAK